MRLKTVVDQLPPPIVYVVLILLAIGTCVVIATWGDAKAHKGPETNAAPATDIRPSLRDERNGVVCYVHYYNGHESMSCVALEKDAGPR